MPKGVYERTRKPVEERFWAKVEQGAPDDCWLWIGATREGYGRIMLEDRTLVDAHRLSFFLMFGFWPPEDTRHRCHTRSCVNPSHLRAGTRAENMQDMVDAGRSMAGERNPQHKLTWDRVRYARALALEGVSAASLARQFGVSQRTMRQCLRGLTWHEKMESGER